MIPDDAILGAMAEYGGSFVQALAECWRRADVENRRILKAAFAGYWAEYAALVAERRRSLNDARGPV